MKAIQKTYKVFNYDRGEGVNLCRAEAKMPSERFNWDEPDFMPIRRVEFINSDRHGCNELTIVKVTALTEAQCDAEISGQISDGAFENCTVGEWYPTETKVVYIKNRH